MGVIHTTVDDRDGKGVSASGQSLAFKVLPGLFDFCSVQVPLVSDERVIYAGARWSTGSKATLIGRFGHTDLVKAVEGADQLFHFSGTGAQRYLIPICRISSPWRNGYGLPRKNGRHGFDAAD